MTYTLSLHPKIISTYFPHNYDPYIIARSAAHDTLVLLLLLLFLLLLILML